MFLKFLDGGNCPVAFDMIMSLGPKHLAGFGVFYKTSVSKFEPSLDFGDYVLDIIPE